MCTCFQTQLFLFWWDYINKSLYATTKFVFPLCKMKSTEKYLKSDLKIWAKTYTKYFVNRYMFLKLENIISNHLINSFNNIKIYRGSLWLKPSDCLTHWIDCKRQWPFKESHSQLTTAPLKLNADDNTFIYRQSRIFFSQLNFQKFNCEYSYI